MLRIVFLLVFGLMFYTGCGKKIVKEEMPSELENLTSTPTEEPNAISSATPEKSVPESTATPAVSSEPTATLKTIEPVKEVLSETQAASEKPTVTNIQTALKNAGIYDGKIDGTLGPKTKKAIENFQTQNNLKADGKVGAKTWSKLKTFLHNPSTSASR